MHCAAPSTSGRKAGGMPDITVNQQTRQLTRWMHSGEMNKVHRAIANNEICLNIQDTLDEWPLFVAATLGYEETCLQMIEHGAKIHILERENETLLHAAITFELPKLFDKLISMKIIDVDAISTAGLTPLYYAISQSDPHYCKTLLEQGADPNLRTKGDEFPLTIAARLKNPVMCEMLLNYGAKVTPESNPTPLWAALANDDYVTAELLLRHGAQMPDATSWAHEPLCTSLQKSVDNTFPEGYTPEPEKYFTGNKPSEAVLSACALGQFIKRVATPLMNADKKLFNQLIDALPKCWNHQYKDLKMTAAKSDALRDSIDLGQEGGRHV